MKILNLFFIALFIFSAALQYNDPDPYLWIPLYFSGAWLCFKSYRKEYNPRIFIPALILYAGFACYYFFSEHGFLNWMNDYNSESLFQSMKATKPWIEETREFLGVSLLFLATGINIIWFYLLRKAGKEITNNATV